MKVCYVTHMPNLYGASQSLLDLLDGLSGTEIEPYVLLGGHGPMADELKKRGIFFKVIPYAPGTDSDNFIKNAGKAFLNSRIPYRVALNRIKAFYIENGIELVHNNSYLVGIGMHAALELHIPYICHIREFVWEGFHRRFFHAKLQRQLLDRADYRIAISEAVRKRYAQDTDQEIYVLNDGIKKDVYQLPLRRVLEGDKIVILIAGRIGAQKGQFEAVKAVELLSKKSKKPIELLIVGGVGDKNYFKELRDYIREKKLGFVKFVGFSDNLREMRRQCDIGLSCSRSEALGRVTIENMLSSLLVVSSDDTVAKELISDQVNGRLYRMGDSENLAGVLAEVVADSESANKLVENAYYDAERFDHRIYAQKVFAIYRKLLDKS